MPKNLRVSLSLDEKLRKVTNQLRDQRKARKKRKAKRKLVYTAKEVDAMPAEKLFKLIGKPAQEEGVRFIPAGWDGCGTVDIDDDDRVEDTYNDEQVTSEWFEEFCANCGQSRDEEDVYDGKNLVLRCCIYCKKP